MTGRRRRRGLLDQHRQAADRLRADDDVGDAGRALEDRGAFLLRDAAGDRDDRIVPLFGAPAARSSPRRVYSLSSARSRTLQVLMTTTSASTASSVGFEAGLLEQAGHPLRVVDVHLAAERLDQVFTRHSVSTLPLCVPCFLCVLWDFRLSPFRFRPRDRRACAPSISRADRRRPSVIAVAAQHSRELVDPARFVEPPHRGSRPAGLDPLLDLEVRVGVRGDLRQVRDAEHLERRAERPQLARRRRRRRGRRCRRRLRRRSGRAPTRSAADRRRR